MTDLVSVIIPTYKRPGKLGRAISSILKQSYSLVEIIVVDDNNDGDEYRLETMDFMQQYKQDSRIKYICHSRNQNGAAARNTGLHYALGEYIAFLDDDDYYLPEKISNDVELLNSLPDEYGGVCSNYLKTYKNWIYKVSHNQGSFDSCYEMLSGKVDFAAGSTLLIKKKCIDLLGGFDTSFYRHQDWEFLIRFFRNYKLYISSSVNVVICADGIRNNPNTARLIAMKKQLMNIYRLDIGNLPKMKQHSIHISQSNEILMNYLKERKYKDSFRFFRSDRYFFCGWHGVPRLTLSFVIGVFPSFMIIVYMMLSWKYQKYSPLLK